MIGIAGNDDAFISDFAKKILARIRNLVGASSTDPHFAVEPFKFVAENLQIGVVPRG